MGKGRGALWALFAAAQDRRIRSIVCDGSLLSYRCLASADRYTHGANAFIRDVLLHFDLPQVAATVADRNLVLLSPVDALGTPVDLSLAIQEYQWTNDAYAAAGASNHFRILKPHLDRNTAEEYLNLLRSDPSHTSPVPS